MDDIRIASTLHTLEKALCDADDDERFVNFTLAVINGSLYYSESTPEEKQYVNRIENLISTAAYQQKHLSDLAATLRQLREELNFIAEGMRMRHFGGSFEINMDQQVLFLLAKIEQDLKEYESTSLSRNNTLSKLNEPKPPPFRLS